MTMAVVTWMSCLMVMVLLMAVTFLNETPMKIITSSMAFESGFDSKKFSSAPFSTNFVGLVLLFLIFDVEVSIMIPMTMTNYNNPLFMVMATLFLGGLLMLLMKEWYNGGLEWAK